jgi:hypothetical protein
MAIVVEQTLSATAKAARYIEAVQKATERGHNLAYEIRETVSSSRRIFFSDEIGNAYKDALDLTAAPPVAWSRLPMIEEGGRLGPDQPGAPMTGNFLLFVSETDATSVVSDAEAGLMRHIDTYRFVATYVRETSRRVAGVDRRMALDLVVWQSVEFPNYQQIIGIEDDDERRSVVASLVNDHGHTLAWDSSGALDDSFFVMTGSGSIAGTPTPGVTISEHATESRRGRLVYANVQLARTDQASRRRRAVFSVDDPEQWRPDGFEVKVVGRSGSRQVWMHLVTEVQAASGQTAAHDSTLIMSTKDL